MKLKEKAANIANNKNIKMLAVLCLLTALALLLSNLGTTLARYVMEISSDSAVVAKPFYFYSDDLKAGYTKVNRGAGNVVDIEISFRNYVDDLRINDESINYQAYVELWNNSRSELLQEEETGVLSGSSKQEATYSYTIPATRLSQSTIIKVVVIGTQTDGYKKTLYQEFGFSDSISTTDYEINDYEDHVEVIIGGAGDGEKVTIQWPSGFMPKVYEFDVVSSTSNSMTISLEGSRVYKVYFFKIDLDMAYNINDFAVIKNSKK